MTKVTDEIEISPLRLLLQLLRRWWLLALCGIVCAGAVFLYSQVFQQQQYRTSVLFYIRNHTEGSSISSSDMDASRELVDHYAVMLSTGPCLAQIADTAGIDAAHIQLAQMLTAEAVGDTAMLRVNITGADSQQLSAVAGAMESVVTEFIAAQLPGSSAALVDPPADPAPLSDPNLPKNMVLGFGIGVALSVLVILVGEIKKTYRTEERPQL